MLPPPRFLVLRVPPELRARLDGAALARSSSRHRTALAALALGVEALPAPGLPSAEGTSR